MLDSKERVEFFFLSSNLHNLFWILEAKEEKKKQNNCVITRKRCIAFGSRSCSEGYRRCRSKRNGQREQLLSVRPAHQHRRHKTHSKKGNGLETSDGSTVKRIASSISWLQYLRKSRQSHQRHKKRYSGFSPCHLKLLPVVCIPAIMHVKMCCVCLLRIHTTPFRRSCVVIYILFLTWEMEKTCAK